jgi:phosphonatase-like hydrolase
MSAPTPIRVVALDMAGTTISDDGVVMDAFYAALVDGGLVEGSRPWEAAEHVVRETMGQSKIDVFRRVFGDEAAAARATAAFENAYEKAVVAGQVTAIAGAEALLEKLRADGVKTCLTTGFSADTRDLLLSRLGWEGVADLVLSPSDVGRGRPFPDLLWTAMLRLGAGSVDEVAVAGDTASDMETARRAGVSVRCGVLTGSDDEARLRAGGATHVLASVADLLRLLEQLG